MRGLFTILFFFMFLAHTQAQPKKSYDHQFSMRYEMPVQYGVGYKYFFNPGVSGSLQVGLLTPPNSDLILDLLEVLGTDELVVDLVENAFQSGVVLETGANFHFKTLYAGFYLQYFSLTGKETPYDIVETVFEEELSSYPRLGHRANPNENLLTLKSNLLQAGILLGKYFSLVERSSIELELAISANILSGSSISSEYRDFSVLSNEVDDYLADIYSNYAFASSINVAYCFKI